MAKIETTRIYQQNDVVPKDWSFPPVFLLGKTFKRLGVGVVIPLDDKGKQKGDRFQMELQLIMLHYRLMPKRKADALLRQKEREVLAYHE